jgi:hypothetical protein
MKNKNLVIFILIISIVIIVSPVIVKQLFFSPIISQNVFGSTHQMEYFCPSTTEFNTGGTSSLIYRYADNLVTHFLVPDCQVLLTRITGNFNPRVRELFDKQSLNVVRETALITCRNSINKITCSRNGEQNCELITSVPNCQVTNEEEEIRLVSSRLASSSERKKYLSENDHLSDELDIWVVTCDAKYEVTAEGIYQSICKLKNE